MSKNSTSGLQQLTGFVNNDIKCCLFFLNRASKLAKFTSCVFDTRNDCIWWFKCLNGDHKSSIIAEIKI